MAAAASPAQNDAAGWYRMVKDYQDAALDTRLGIPILYGVDAVHGHNNVIGATIFPQQVGLGASHDVDLVKRIGEATAIEMAATGIRWDFGPVVAVPQDVRWGRTYEGYGEDPLEVAKLGEAFIRGLQGDDLTARRRRSPRPSTSSATAARRGAPRRRPAIRSTRASPTSTRRRSGRSTSPRTRRRSRPVRGSSWPRSRARAPARSTATATC